MMHGGWMTNGGSHQQQPSVTLNSNHLHWLYIVNTALKNLGMSGENERGEVVQVQCDRADAFHGGRLQFRLEIDL